MSLAPGLYVHVPFCASKCHYCGFYSETGGVDPDWVDAVLLEAVMYAGRFAAFDTVYLGGGTPSLLHDSSIAKLLAGLRNTLGIDEHAEITIEVNPGDVDEPRAHRWLDMGIRRVSLGVQAFDDASLIFLGRRHTGQRAREAVGLLRGAGFRSLGLDLIWGIPGQSPEACLASVDEAIAFEPEHVSCYELTIEPETPLARSIERGTVVMPRDDNLADLGAACWKRLTMAGYEHYEVSNFAKSPAHRSKHNTKYWCHVPYLGLGPSAHSFDGARRWANVRSVERYQAALRSGARPLAFEEVLTDEQRTIERVALGIRTSSGVSVDDVPRGWVDSMIREGFVRVDGGFVVPTEEGMLVADALARSLVE